ncbi:MAG: hypothetical protein RL095_3655 [Verrucomicrobiota bacterium]|jgi:cytochrome c553
MNSLFLFIVLLSEEPSVGYNEQVLPILSDKCFACHGNDKDKIKGDLQLHTFALATKPFDEGHAAIVPGHPEKSSLIERIHSDDEEERMPPQKSHKTLSAAEKKILETWIKQGAPYEKHWAFVPPKSAPAPAVKDASWAKDPLDRYVLAKLEKAGLKPKSEASRAELLRRVHLVLTGLPPSPEEVTSFEQDQSSVAYEKRVEALLASNACAEHLAQDWMDAARFADTHGYQSDTQSRNWPWRDWVIGAFRKNLSYDQFLTWQIAGDLLPQATQEQKLATAFNRLHRMTQEGGSIDEEFRQEAVADRVETFSAAFLGMTTGCARCHDHKFDPISQKDFFALGACFDRIDEAGTIPFSTSAVARPALHLSTPAQDKKLAELASAEKLAADKLTEIALDAQACAEWAKTATPKLPEPIASHELDGKAQSPAGPATLLDGDSGPALDKTPAFHRCDPLSVVLRLRAETAAPRATILHGCDFTIETDQQGYQLMIKDGHLSFEIIHLWPGSAIAIRSREPLPLKTWHHVTLTYDGSSRAAGMKIWLNGKELPCEVLRDHLDGPTPMRQLQVGWRSRNRDFGFKDGQVDELRVYGVELHPLEIDLLNGGSAFAEALKKPDAALLQLWQRRVQPQWSEAAQALQKARRAHQDLFDSIPQIPVMAKSPVARKSYVLKRGAYDQPDLEREVQGGALEEIFPFKPEWPRDRLGLARWATDKENPLTSRVAVNRYWALCFGEGLMMTRENFGTQGEAPAQRELFDALAREFVDGGWDVRALLRRIVLSATFRQSSACSQAEWKADPANRMLARGPSFRLSGEALRDQALKASGLLVDKLGGPSVKPWQPAGVWEDSGAAGGSYHPDKGENAHRRSLYTFRKRTAPPPNLQLFDAGSREVCSVRRQNTNTPLQALALLNDEVFLETARALAARALKEAPESAPARAFTLLCARAPSAKEAAALDALFTRQLALHPGAPEKALANLCSVILASDAACVVR